MAAQQETNSEPSIEEILDSIRQIIADDDEGGGENSAKPAETPAAAPVQKSVTENPPQDDIIELTERVEEPKAAAAPPPPPPPPPAPEPVKEPVKQEIQIDMQEPEPEPAKPPTHHAPPQPEPRLAMTPPPPLPETMDNLESVLTQKAEAAALKAFTELTHRATIEKGGGVTIEDVVRYEVRPLLRAWIDKYLPGMVERLLQKELEKISRRFDQE